MNNYLVYKYTTWSGNTRDAVEKRYFWFAKPDNFNDPFDSNMEILNSFKDSKKIFNRKFLGNQTLLEVVKKNTKGFGILCLTKPTLSGSIGKNGYDNLHFWSHYASSYQGIAIGFEQSSIENYYSEKIMCKASLL